MITVLSLSPAVDKIYTIDDFCAGGLYRVNNCLLSPGGKGINVAKVTRMLDSQVAVLGFKAGSTGQWLEKSVRALGAETHFTSVEGESRTNINIIDKLNNRETEILEDGPIIDPEAWETFCEQFNLRIRTSSVLVCSGGLPKGLDTGTYARLIEQANKYSIRTILDSSGEVLELGIKARPYMIKPNLRELSTYFGRSFTQEDQIIAACKEIINKGIKVVVTSLGAQGALLVTENKAYRAHPFSITIANTIGSGDSMVAGISAGIDDNKPIEECFRLGCACATSNTEFMEIGMIDKNRVGELEEKILIESINLR